KIIEYTKNNDSAKVWLSDLGFDSVKFDIKDEGKILQTVNITRGKKETYTRNLQMSDNTSANVLNPNRPLKLVFNLPVEKLDISKVTLLEDSVPRTNFTMTKDT